MRNSVLGPGEGDTQIELAWRVRPGNVEQTEEPSNEHDPGERVSRSSYDAVVKIETPKYDSLASFHLKHNLGLNTTGTEAKNREGWEIFGIGLGYSRERGRRLPGSGERGKTCSGPSPEVRYPWIGLSTELHRVYKNRRRCMVPHSGSKVDPWGAKNWVMNHLKEDIGKQGGLAGLKEPVIPSQDIGGGSP